jgi:hypothetical protein
MTLTPHAGARRHAFAAVGLSIAAAKGPQETLSLVSLARGR